MGVGTVYLCKGVSSVVSLYSLSLEKWEIRTLKIYGLCGPLGYSGQTTVVRINGRARQVSVTGQLAKVKVVYCLEIINFNHRYPPGVYRGNRFPHPL